MTVTGTGRRLTVRGAAIAGPSTREWRLPAGVAAAATAFVFAVFAAAPGPLAPVAAHAAGQSTLSATSTDALGGGVTAPGATPTTTTATPTVAATATTSSGSGGGISSTSAIVIALAAVVIIAGIIVAIFRDARRRIPSRSAAGDTRDQLPGSKRPKPRKLSAAEKRRRKRGRAPRRR